MEAAIRSLGETLTGSAVARKLEGLGALTKGDKSAGRGETGNNLGVNMETKAGLDALRQLTVRSVARVQAALGQCVAKKDLASIWAVLRNS